MSNIIKFPDPILREIMPDFDFQNPIMDPALLESELVTAMLGNGGVGLSANQIGVRCKVFAMGHSEQPESAQAFFNPVIIKVSTDTNDMIEGCLSFPGVYVNIKRPRVIQVGWQDRTGQWHEDEFDGYTAKCFCHEFDHINGIAMPDRVSQLRWAMSLKKSIKASKK